MKKVKNLVLDIQRNGMPKYVKQSIEISSNGYINHCLYPMVYLGQMKKYEFKLEETEVEEFFSNFDFSTWKEIKAHYINTHSYTLKVIYDDGSVIVKNGYINTNMPECYSIFDEKLLDLVIFVERPWLFTL